MPTQPPHVQFHNTSTACKPHRVAVGASGSSPETHAMHPFPRRRHNNTTTGSIRGRASTRPYTACICHDTTTACTCHDTSTACTMPQHIHRMQMPHANHRAQTPSRSCRGEWKLARNTHAMHPFSHAGNTTIPPQGTIRGRASTRPYTAYIYANTSHYGMYNATTHPPHANPLHANPIA